MKNLRAALIAAGALIAIGALLCACAYLLGVNKVWESGSFRLPDWISLGSSESRGGSFGGENGSSQGSRDGSFGSGSGSSQGNSGGSFGSGAESEYTISADALRGLSIDWSAGAVELSVSPDDGEVRFSESAKRELSDDERLVWSLEDGMLRISFCAKGIKLSLPEKTLRVSLPLSAARQLSSLSTGGSSARVSVSGSFQCPVELYASSGDISFQGSCTRLDCESSSGSISAELLSPAESITASSTSGEINVSGQCGRASLESSSGDITAALVCTEISTSSSSGSAQLSGSFESVSAQSSSGDLKIVSSSAPEYLCMESSSGRAELSLPAGSGFELRVDTASGDFSSELPLSMHGRVYTAGDGTGSYSISTSSGDITIYEN